MMREVDWNANVGAADESEGSGFVGAQKIGRAYQWRGI